MNKSILLVMAIGIFLMRVVSANETTVVMMGDSTTSCERNTAGKKLTELVEKKLKESIKAAEFKVVNSGVGGSTAKEAVPRVQASVIAHKPEIVTISFGLNDTGKSTPEEFSKSLEDIIDAIQKDSKAKIMLITSSPFDNARHAWKDKFPKVGLDETLDTKFCEEMRKLALKKKVGLCDLHKDMSAAFKKDPNLINKVIMPDGVHLTDEGNELASGFIVADITKLLKGAKK